MNAKSEVLVGEAPVSPVAAAGRNKHDQVVRLLLRHPGVVDDRSAGSKFSYWRNRWMCA